jgi:CheY-like chemotaxis protein
MSGKIKKGLIMKPLDILVIEDSVEQVALLKMKVHKLLVPVELEITESVEEGVARLKVRGKTPDLVLLDLNLPDGSGLDVLRQMKELLGKDMPPVVVVSATIKPEEKAGCYREGATCFLPKPYDEELLNGVLMQLRATNRLKPA